jgi:hypothetical protein
MCVAIFLCVRVCVYFYCEYNIDANFEPWL